MKRKTRFFGIALLIVIFCFNHFAFPFPHVYSDRHHERVTSIGSNTSLAQNLDSALSFGKEVSESIQYNDEHAYTLEANAGQYVDIEVVQRGTNIGVTVFAPDGTVVAAEDVQKHVHAVERLSFEAGQGGTYRIKLSPQPGFSIQTGLDANAFIWDGERRVPYEMANDGGEYTLTVSRPSTSDSSKLGQIDRLFRPYATAGSAGVAVGIVKDGAMLFSRGYGLANLEYGIPVSPHTPFHIASVSKQFAGYAIAALHDAGKLSLDDDIHQYLPELKTPERTTIRQLLNHTSGIRDQWVVAALAGWRMDDVITQEQLLGLIFSQEALNFPPGTAYQYSNSNYTLAAEIVRRVTGRTLREWTTAEVFEPLGMRNTFFYDDHEEILPQRAYSYDDRSGTVKKSVLSFANYGATSLFTTVHDFVKWMPNFRHPSVGNARIFELMTTRGKLNDGTRLSYALGVAVGQYKGLPTIDHSGVDAGYRSFMLYFPEQDVGIIVLSNLASCNTVDLARRTADILLDLPTERKPEALKPQAPAQPYGTMAYEPTALASDYTGVYYCPEIQTEYRISEREGQLYLSHKRFSDVRLLPTAADRLKGTYWIFDDMEFSRNRRGEVTGFTVSNRGVTRMEFTKLTEENTKTR
ncbi:serine hydrolase [Parapedobacter soli]|uniref:serine hydrolase n=1 Tax=Parapedobacter soli TaxID=416955 RepID=UPI0021C78552|nr:serine hydrolase [Parapedobacter soli]